MLNDDVIKLEGEIGAEWQSLRLSVQMVILSEVRRVKIIHWGKKIEVSVPYGTLGARGTKSRVSTFCTLTPRAHRHFFPTNMF